jgi:long-subunit acyl-CoA synthetase (AMP-forming)
MFKFKRTFGTKIELEKIENKISNTSNIEEALSCIPSNYPSYIVD